MTRIDDTDLAEGRHSLRCTACHSMFPVSRDTGDQLAGAPCLHQSCTGTLTREPGDPGNFYRHLYRSGDARQIVAREHTSLLDAQQRLDYENGFKRSGDDPSAPNVLVATPTLEMGIDIGDLSAVFLASLPRRVANYVQRVGRAGRLTGNALDIAFARGRGEVLSQLGDPLSLINGAVTPPATYLSAEEILRRQYLAHLADRLARDPKAIHPRTTAKALELPGPGTFLGQLIELARTDAEDTLAGFLASFDVGETSALRTETIEAMRSWAIPGDDGFALAELDLQLRSEGDVLGAAQAGRGSHLRFLSVAKDRKVIETARAAAREAVAADPELAEHPALADAVAAIDAGRADYLERG